MDVAEGRVVTKEGQVNQGHDVFVELGNLELLLTELLLDACHPRCHNLLFFFTALAFTDSDASVAEFLAELDLLETGTKHHSEQ